jgi:sterol 3beta-glucosyltransferase
LLTCSSQENGVNNAIQAIYRDLEYARTLIKKRDGASDDLSDDFEESWTFIGDEGDPELFKRMADMEGVSYLASARQHGGSPVTADIGAKGVSLGKDTTN